MAKVTYHKSHSYKDLKGNEHNCITQQYEIGTYAIPTKDASIRRSLTVNEIEPYVSRFIMFAKHNPELTFLVTAIGTGLAGHKAKDIAPLFKDAIEIENIHLPEKFWKILSKK